MKTESKSAPKTAPDHLAIILDGNGRWARRRGLPRLMGHRAGLRKLEEMVRLVKRRGIRYLEQDHDDQDQVGVEVPHFLLLTTHTTLPPLNNN